MFNLLENKPGFSLLFLLFVIGQSFLLFMVPIVLGAGFENLFAPVAGRSGYLALWALSLSGGILLGFALGTVSALVRDTGVYVWIIPATLWLLGFVNDVRDYSFETAIRDTFFVGPGEEGLILVLITLPTCFCSCYSLGTLFARQLYKI